MWASRRVKKLLELTPGKKYLEVGVFRGETFLDIDADLKVAVDPYFQFDVAPYENSRCKFLSMPSDEAFAQLDMQDMTFDVIFLDGLHTFEQTYRDLINALSILEPGGLILVDDVFPCDEFSFIPNYESALRARQLATSENPLRHIHWHGDVFKVMAMVHDYHFGLEYRTFWGSGNEQAVIWESAPQQRLGRFNDIRSISSLSYSELLANQDILFKDSEENIFNLLSDIFKS